MCLYFCANAVEVSHTLSVARNLFNLFFQFLGKQTVGLKEKRRRARELGRRANSERERALLNRLD